MPKVRFFTRCEPNGTWSVFDAKSGEIPKIGGQFVCDLSEAEAADIAFYLNWQSSFTHLGLPTRRH